MIKKNENKTKQNSQFIITPQGSLGLLAYGDIGLRAWRKVKETTSKDGLNEEE